MRMRKAKLWLPSSLLLTCLALTWLIYEQLTMAPNSEAFARPSTQRTIDLPDLPLELQFAMPAIETYQAVLERPLFSPNRRPPPTAIAALKGFNFTLMGVLIDKNLGLALLRRQGDGKDVRMRVGEEIEGWTLLEVALDFIVVERDGQEEILEPAFDVQTSPVTGAPRDKTKQ